MIGLGHGTGNESQKEFGFITSDVVGTHVGRRCVKRAVQNEDGLFYDCYDSQDGDHYKWVSAYDISFELASGH